MCGDPVHNTLLIHDIRPFPPPQKKLSSSIIVIAKTNTIQSSTDDNSTRSDGQPPPSTAQAPADTETGSYAPLTFTGNLTYLSHLAKNDDLLKPAGDLKMHGFCVCQISPPTQTESFLSDNLMITATQLVERVEAMKSLKRLAEAGKPEKRKFWKGLKGRRGARVEGTIDVTGYVTTVEL